MGSKSKSSSKQTSNFYDNRQVNDAGGGVIGSGTVDNSIQLVDGSRTSTDNSIKLSDSSRTSTVNTVSDSGAIKAAQQIATDAIKATSTGQASAFNFASTSAKEAMTLATKAQTASASFNEQALSKAFDLAKSSQAQAFSNMTEALGGVASSWQASADTNNGNRTLILAALGAVALVGVAMAFKG